MTAPNHAHLDAYGIAKAATYIHTTPHTFTHTNMVIILIEQALTQSLDENVGPAQTFLSTHNKYTHSQSLDEDEGPAPAAAPAEPAAADSAAADSAAPISVDIPTDTTMPDEAAAAAPMQNEQVS